MDLFEVIHKRRTVRKFTSKKVPDSVIQKALESAILAPNSSNMQTWDFYWVSSAEAKLKLAEACLNQSAAKTASDFIVVVANQKKWKRSQPELLKLMIDTNADKGAVNYYKNLMPFLYTAGPFGILSSLKWILFNTMGLFKPTPRHPYNRRDIQEVCVKSAALACENFVLSIVAQGYAAATLEGIDEVRVKKAIGLNWKDTCNGKVVMVISVGEAAEGGIYGPQFRLPYTTVVHKI